MIGPLLTSPRRTETQINLTYTLNGYKPRWLSGRKDGRLKRRIREPFRDLFSFLLQNAVFYSKSCRNNFFFLLLQAESVIHTLHFSAKSVIYILHFHNKSVIHILLNKEVWNDYSNGTTGTSSNVNDNENENVNGNLNERRKLSTLN